MFEFLNNQFLLEKLGEAGHFSDRTLVVCAHVPDQQGPQISGWPWIRNSTEGVMTSSEPSVALFPTHSNCPEAQRWEASTGEEGRVGLKR